MRKIKYVFFILFLAFSMLAAENYEQKISRSFQLAAGGAVDLSNVNGAIDITSTGGTSIDIKAIKKSDHKGEIEYVEVLFEQDGNTLRVKTKYNRKNINAKVDFTVVIPEKLAKAEFKSVNGKIDCSGKFSDLLLKTVNGKIDFQGQFRSGAFKTVNGAIEISQEPLLSGDLSADTVNGSIDIELNSKSAFAVEGHTVNGHIDSDFGLNVDRHLVGRSLSGTINGGGHKVEVETVNGSIEISKI